MTAREWCAAMLLDYAHCESWTESDRDAFLRWRLTELAEHARAVWREWQAMGKTRAEFTTAFRHYLCDCVKDRLAERHALYRPRYTRCSCKRCRPPVVNPFFERVAVELEMIERGIRARRGAA